LKNSQALSVCVLCLVLLLAACRQQEIGPRLGLEVPLRIMPMGDSITEGLCDTQDTCEEPAEWMIPTTGDGVEACGWAANPYNPEAVGYRAFLRDMIAAKGLDMSYVGSVAVVEGLAHEGHTGWQILDLDYCVQNGDWLEKAQPNVILLHIGTNDASEGRAPEEMVQSLLELLQHIYEKVPATTEVIVAQIIPARQSWMKSVITPYNELIPGVVDELVAEGKHVSYVDMTGVILSDSDLDRFGHHPNAVASERMAQVWYAKILDIIGQNP
jgi:lysophospholipase L1-like esterase